MLRRLLLFALLTTTPLLAQQGSWTTIFERSHPDSLQPSPALAISPAGVTVLAYNDSLHALDASGAITWSRPLTVTSGFQSLTFSDASHAAAVDLKGKLHVSTDGGMSWMAAPGTSGDTINSVEGRADGLILAVGASGLVLRSTDHGATWSRSHTGPKDFLWSIDVAQPDILHVAAYTFAVYRSTDRGVTWSLLSSDEANFGEINDLHFTSADTGFVASIYPWGIMRTYDGGVSWEWLGFSYPDQFAFISRDVGYTLSYGYPTGLVRTTDGGVTWPDTLHTNGGPGDAFQKVPRDLVLTSPTTGFVLITEFERTSLNRFALPFAVAGVDPTDGDDGVRLTIEHRTIRLEAVEGIASEVTVYDMLGRRVAAGSGSVVVEGAGTYVVQGGDHRWQRVIVVR